MHPQDPIIILFVFLFGTVLGSFGSVIVFRFPRGEGLGGRSHCTSCNHTLHWYDLIPLLSFIVLRGRCHYCHDRISLRYPLLELSCGALITLAFILNQSTSTPTLLLLGACVYLLILIAHYDFETQKIPNVLLVLFFLFALFERTLTSSALDPLILRDAFYGASIPLLFFGGLWTISGRQWIGSGDILLGANIGLLLGLANTLIALFLTYTTGAIIVLTLLLLRRTQTGNTIAFGPFLCIGALLTLFAGEDIFRWYWDMVLLS